MYVLLTLDMERMTFPTDLQEKEHVGGRALQVLPNRVTI